MPLFRGWKATSKDLAEYSRAYERAYQAVNSTVIDMTDAGLDTESIENNLPYEGHEVMSVEELQSSFVSRADFRREVNRMKRIDKAYHAAPRKGVVTLGDGRPNQLNSFYYDADTGEIGSTQYMTNETNFYRRQRNIRNIKELAERGIEFMKVKVLDPLTGKPVYDQNRHQVTIQVPKTPQQLRDYQAVIQRDPDLAVTHINVEEDDVIELWGDTVEVINVERRHQPSPTKLYEETMIDKGEALKTERFFDNYKLLIDTTMPPVISDEIDEYIDAIKDIGPHTMNYVYKMMERSEDDAGSIEYLYMDMSQTLPARMKTIINFWRSEVAPQIGFDERPPIELTEVSRDLEDFGYEMKGVHPIFAEFNAMRLDTPKRKRNH